MPTDVHMLTDAELDRALAEACGLLCCCGHAILRGRHVSAQEYICPDCEKTVVLDFAWRFSRSFDALFATENRDGFDGPVQRAYSKANSVVNGAPYPQAYRDFHKLFPAKGWSVHTEVFRMARNLLDRGPRPLTEACLVVLAPDKYTMGMNHE